MSGGVEMEARVIFKRKGVGVEGEDGVGMVEEDAVDHCKVSFCESQRTVQPGKHEME